MSMSPNLSAVCHYVKLYLFFLSCPPGTYSLRLVHIGASGHSAMLCKSDGCIRWVVLFWESVSTVPHDLCTPCAVDLDHLPPPIFQLVWTCHPAPWKRSRNRHVLSGIWRRNPPAAPVYGLSPWRLGMMGSLVARPHGVRQSISVGWWQGDRSWLLPLFTAVCLCIHQQCVCVQAGGVGLIHTPGQESRFGSGASIRLLHHSSAK